jgi:hypothetical protein
MSYLDSELSVSAWPQNSLYRRAALPFIWQGSSIFQTPEYWSQNSSFSSSLQYNHHEISGLFTHRLWQAFVVSSTLTTTNYHITQSILSGIFVVSQIYYHFSSLCTFGHSVLATSCEPTSDLCLAELLISTWYTLFQLLGWLFQAQVTDSSCTFLQHFVRPSMGSSSNGIFMSQALS